MKHRLMVKFLSAAIALCAVPQLSVRHSLAARPAPAVRLEGREEQDWPEQERVDRSYQLSLGAKVEVSMIYGPVDIETAEADTAEVHIVRYARTREDLASRRIAVENTSAGLAIRGEQDRSEGPARVRHRVLLKLPHRVELSVEKINGQLNVGEIDGAVRLTRVNGAVKIAAAAGYAEISNVNGSLTASFPMLSPQGVRVEHVNGSVELRFPADLSAELSVTEFNGGVNTGLPNVDVLENSKHKSFRARIGSGSVPITLSDVNGGVRIVRSL